MVSYSIEYKTCAYPYQYKYLERNRDYVSFDNIGKARRCAIELIKDYTAILCVIRGNGKEGLVYATRDGHFVFEDRGDNPNAKSKWYHLRADGKLGTQIRKINYNNLIRSAWD